MIPILASIDCIDSINLCSNGHTIDRTYQKKIEKDWTRTDKMIIANIKVTLQSIQSI